jgi:hypothetical protein
MAMQQQGADGCGDGCSCAVRSCMSAHHHVGCTMCCLEAGDELTSVLLLCLCTGGWTALTHCCPSSGVGCQQPDCSMPGSDWRGPVTLSPCHPVTLSPCHPVTLSPCHPVTLSPSTSLHNSACPPFAIWLCVYPPRLTMVLSMFCRTGGWPVPTHCCPSSGVSCQQL